MTTAALRFGILPVDKPSGPTSHDIVERARRSLGVRRIGHTGTLDPFASGLLLLCVGPATRLAEYFSALDKRYVATVLLGVQTDTDDLDGSVVRASEAWRSLDDGRISDALRGFLGPSLQVPPRYSAKKAGGRRLYEHARAGRPLAPEPVPVEIQDVSMLDIRLPEVTFAVSCSSGTYVRALARDLGETLGVGGHLIRLRRTSIGPFHVESAVADLHAAECVAGAWLSPARALAGWPRSDVDSATATRLAHGETVAAPESVALAAGPVAVFQGERLVAIALVQDGVLRPAKVFAHD
ncbi:MAG: tRNA pseudouridine(55) synthase TruB [Gemmatimonadetes bacterium]|nr:tRNA pseudouridine(55) synthase TruB [Gemmatimonadota bacterium]